MGEWWILVVKSSTTSWVQWVKAEVVGFGGRDCSEEHGVKEQDLPRETLENLKLGPLGF